MATELTWTADVNRQVASAADAATQNKWEMWYLLASLVGNTGLGFASNAGNWTVVRTCGSTDGTSGTLTADTTDRLHLGSSGAFTANDWVFGANSSAGRSWALLQSPSGIGSYYMVIDFEDATGGKCQIAFGKTLSGNGSTTAIPTFSDGWSYTSAQYNVNTITATHRCHLMLSSRGDFCFYESYDTLGDPYSILACTKLASTHSADNYTTISLFAGAGGVNGVTGLTSAITSTGCLCGSTNVLLKGRNFSGSGTPTMLGLIPCYSSAGSGSNSITQNGHVGLNASDATYNGFVLWVMDHSNTDLKGRMPDWLWASGTPAQISNAPNSTPYEYIKVGHCWAPWTASSAMNP